MMCCSDYDKLLKLAVKVASKAHKNQYDKGGKPYFEHPDAVARSLSETKHKITAYLHDVCEDTPITFEDLLDMGFTEEIVNSVKLLTKSPGQSYDEYLKGICTDSCAKAVKIADLKHNMELSRIPFPEEKDFARVEKYKKALAFLESEQ